MPQPKPTIVITGAHGFLGSSLVQYFASQGWSVIGLVRDPQPSDLPGVTYKNYDLSKPLDDSVFNGADYLVHVAFVKYDRQHPDAFSVNVSAAKHLLQAGKKHKLKKMLFISSMSAHQEARSIYGKQKLAIEKLFIAAGGVVMRPGLIIGPGGIVQEMSRLMKKLHVVPLVGRGRQPLQVISIANLVLAIDRALVKHTSSMLTVASPQIYDYKYFYKALARHLKTRVWLVPLPFVILKLLLAITDILHLHIGITNDNLLGLKQLRSADTEPSLKAVGLTTDSLEIALAQLDSGSQ